MIQEERKKELLKLIEEAGYCTVEYLASRIYTSQSTVRRNLAELEKQGLVKRSYGGAELCKNTDNVPLKLRYKKNHHLKDNIARQAVERIQDNTVIFLDASSTCLHMIPHLPVGKNITVYTNSLETCSLLASTGIPTYCLGGQLLPKSLAFTGAPAVQMAQTLYFDALFFSCSGYADEVISDYSEAEAYLRRTLLQQSAKKYFLCDSTKLGKRFTYVICKRTDVTEIITD